MLQGEEEVMPKVVAMVLLALRGMQRPGQLRVDGVTLANLVVWPARLGMEAPEEPSSLER
jgi:hypothetical protein